MEERLAARSGGGFSGTRPWGLRELENVMGLTRRAAPPRLDMAWNVSPNVWQRDRVGSRSAAAPGPLLPRRVLEDSREAGLLVAVDGSAVDASEHWLLDRPLRNEDLALSWATGRR
mmetsp:Transcript_94616/g.256810  ORF Transcript_94616/g.256810 Transcript_94616/m.256810 type:complete len:116 (+) Transcript_94616:681-1028(+)